MAPPDSQPDSSTAWTAWRNGAIAFAFFLLIGTHPLVQDFLRGPAPSPPPPIPAEWLQPPMDVPMRATPAAARPAPARRTVAIDRSQQSLADRINGQLGTLYTLIQPEYENGGLGPGSIYRSNADGTTLTQSQLDDRQARALIMAVQARQKAE